MSFGSSVKFRKPDVFNIIKLYLAWILENIENDVQIETTTMKPTSSLEQILNHKNIGMFSLDDCGRTLGSKRISGGNKTSLFEFPW